MNLFEWWSFLYREKQGLDSQHLQAPTKRSQHLSTTYRHCRAQHVARLATMLQRAATCWVLKIELVRIPW